MSSRLLAVPLSLALLLSGSTATPTTPTPATPYPAHPYPPRPAIELVAYTDCTRLTDDLRRAARESVGPIGFSGPLIARASAEGDMAKTADVAAVHSGTNNHESGADEPDLVKTDGRRIVTLTGGVLRIVDTTTRTETGRLDLKVGDGTLLLRGDHALVLGSEYGATAETPTDFGGTSKIAQSGTVVLLLVQLTPAPKVLSRYTADARLVDARLTGDRARVILRSTPRIDFPDQSSGTDQQRIDANRKVIAATPLDAWLPRYQVTTGGVREEGRVGCDRVRTPPTFSGASLVTVLTVDLTRNAFTDLDPLTVAADGDTVYATPTSLYVANDDRWRGWRTTGAETAVGKTELYRFDITGRTTYQAAGTVDGTLLNQYALSEWNGHLRVATTLGIGDRAHSAVEVLRPDGGTLTRVGRLDGLGRKERIHAVRFLEGRVYVVTFRQTDPLYSLDLTDPAAPAVTGELKITGYSAHLQPVGPDRLVGIGQEASTEGRLRGNQVSLFDVKNPKAPTRLAQQHVADSWSEAENDPHAVLWWPATSLLVVPVAEYRGSDFHSRAVAYRVEAAGLTRVGAVEHPAGRGNLDPSIRRTLVVGNTLWTLSGTGLRASDLGTLQEQAWVPVA